MQIMQPRRREPRTLSSGMPKTTDQNKSSNNEPMEQPRHKNPNSKHTLQRERLQQNWRHDKENVAL